jgi:hypothetical protein
VLRQRLQQRGRESEAEIALRLERAARYTPSDCLTLNNNGSLGNPSTSSSRCCVATTPDKRINMPTCELRAPTLDDVDAVYVNLRIKAESVRSPPFHRRVCHEPAKSNLRYQLAQVEERRSG